MPEFVKPFSGMVPERKLTIGELDRALRLDLAAISCRRQLVSSPETVGVFYMR
jgi:hypothetical protein